MNDQILAKLKPVFAAALLLVLSALPLLGRSLLTTKDGAAILGDVEQEQLDFSSVGGGDVILPRAALDRLRTLPDGTVQATLKDGKSLVGTLAGELTITDGLIKRRFQPTDISEVAFDVFVDLGEVSELVCPIRAAIELPSDLVVGKLKTWRTARTRLASCDGHFLNSVDFSRQRNALQTYVKAGEKPRKGTVLSIKPSVILAAGEDQFVHLTFILMQGDKALAKVAHKFEGDEGELNNFPPVQLWVATEEIVADGPPLTLRFQMLTRERGTNEKPDPVFIWFVKIRL